MLPINPEAQLAFQSVNETYKTSLQNASETGQEAEIAKSLAEDAANQAYLEEIHKNDPEEILNLEESEELYNLGLIRRAIVTSPFGTLYSKWLLLNDYARNKPDFESMLQNYEEFTFNLIDTYQNIFLDIASNHPLSDEILKQYFDNFTRLNYITENEAASIINRLKAFIDYFNSEEHINRAHYIKLLGYVLVDSRYNQTVLDGKYEAIKKYVEAGYITKDEARGIFFLFGFDKYIPNASIEINILLDKPNAPK